MSDAEVSKPGTMKSGSVCGTSIASVPCQVDPLTPRFVSTAALSNVRLEVPAGRVDEARRLLAEREQAPALGEDEEGR